MDEFYYVLYDGRGLEAFEDDDDEGLEGNFKLTLERARYVRDHIINPDYNPRIVRGNPVQ